MLTAGQSPRAQLAHPPAVVGGSRTAPRDLLATHHASHLKVGGGTSRHCKAGQGRRIQASPQRRAQPEPFSSVLLSVDCWLPPPRCRLLLLPHGHHRYVLTLPRPTLHGQRTPLHRAASHRPLLASHRWHHKEPLPQFCAGVSSLHHPPPPPCAAAVAAAGRRRW